MAEQADSSSAGPTQNGSPSASGGPLGGKPKTRRGSKRGHSQEGKRVRRGSINYNHREWDLIIQAAALADGQAPGAFVVQVALDVARAKVAGRPLTDREMLSNLYDAVQNLTFQMRAAGVNLNAVAAHANATGELAPVADRARAVTERVNGCLSQLGGLLEQIREELQ